MGLVQQLHGAVAEVGSLRAGILVLLVPAIAFVLWRVLYTPKREYPDAPWLRLSKLPGAAGEKEDANLYVENGHKVLCEG